MWESLQQQVKQLMESTLATSAELAEYASGELGKRVHPSEITHAVNDGRGATRKGRQLLIVCQRHLTEVQERQNREIAQQMRRAEKALENAR